MTLANLVCNVTKIRSIEEERLLLQARLDADKTQAERNRCGQFATPAPLAKDIIKFGLTLVKKNRAIRFLDPALGTGAFFSAILHSVTTNRIEAAKGFELDPHYAEPTQQLWRNTLLDLHVSDFTRVIPPSQDEQRYNFLVCNPPYVRHHHIANSEKLRLNSAAKAACGVSIPGLSGLYCYFLALSHPWMQTGGIAAWLIPSEFMDVNYGQAVKRYLLEKVTLIRIHRFDPNDVQFDDAMVSSAVVWLRNNPPPLAHRIEFTFGGSLLSPANVRYIPMTALMQEHKWTRFPTSDVRLKTNYYRLSDFFTIKRGIATGSNKFFILPLKEIESRGLPLNLFCPILPSPRYLNVDEVISNEEGFPVLEQKLFVIDCRLSETQIENRFPQLWKYLEEGRDKISGRYLCRSRKIWYFQDKRPPAPILCTYMGRNTRNGKPFRFILNHSKAIAANVYLLLYPKAVLAKAIAKDKSLLLRIWEILNNLPAAHLVKEGRVYGGGLHKIEPKELSNVDASAIVKIIPNSDHVPRKTKQLELF